jgi:hypothetical protein
VVVEAAGFNKLQHLWCSELLHLKDFQVDVPLVNPLNPNQIKPRSDMRAAVLLRKPLMMQGLLWLVEAD